MNFGICKLLRKFHCYHDVFSQHYPDGKSDCFQVCCHCGEQKRTMKKRSKLHGHKHIQVGLE